MNGTTFPDLPGGYGQGYQKYPNEQSQNQHREHAPQSQNHTQFSGAQQDPQQPYQRNGQQEEQQRFRRDDSYQSQGQQTQQAYAKSYGAGNGGSSWEKKPWSPGGNSNGGGKFQRKEEVLDPTIYLPCAVAGNKEAPPEVINKIKELVGFLSQNGFTIREGCEGPVELAADEAATQKRERILAWRDFAEKESKLTWNSERANYVAKLFHPTYDAMKKGIQHILGKNARLILGDKMNSPARLLLTWSEDGIEHSRGRTSRTGLVGHTIAIATAAGVPIYNLGNSTAEQRLREYVGSLFQ